ncbi:MAG: sialate O-acetylesterase [Bacteroidota bacterium]
MPPLFSDHMVLQRSANINVWGKATPNSKITVRFNNQKSEITSSADSTWRVVLAPEEAGGPFELTVEGETTLTFNDVLVGEVWLASGQSNMQWPLEATNNGETAIATAQDDQIRLFTVRNVVSATPSQTIPADGWKVNSPSTVSNFSAVAYYFAQTLRDSLNVPVGLINSSWGGTRAEAWTSSETLLEHPDYAELVQEIVDDPAAYDATATAAEWRQAVHDNDAGYTDGNPAWAALELDGSDWEVMPLPQLWEGVLNGLDGIIWFRKTINLPADWDGKAATVSLAKIDDEDQTWVNGTLVGETAVYNAPRTYAIPPNVLKAGENVIVVRALDTGGGGGIWGEAETMHISLGNSQQSRTLAGDWQYKLGLDFRDAALPRRPTGQQHTPTVLYNAMIHPLVPYSLEGVIWYQGESNASRAHQYQTLFPAMIQDWRTKWDSPLGFHFVQLANFMNQQVNPVEQQSWPELREAQTMALSLPNTGMAVTIDIGEADDIHPRNKKDVGFRLALSALHATYGHDNIPAGPLYQSHEIADDSVRLTFAYAEKGLMTPDNAVLQGFAIAGEDQEWHRGTATIVGNNVVVRSSRVSAPVAVRYGWADNPVVNLYNTAGLPASPFRTDDWEGVTFGNTTP